MDGNERTDTPHPKTEAVETENPSLLWKLVAVVISLIVLTLLLASAVGWRSQNYIGGVKTRLLIYPADILQL